MDEADRVQIVNALEIVDEIGAKYQQASSLTEIGIVYLAQGDYKKAEVYFEKSLTLQKKIGIIGGSGFVGSQLGRNLIKNNRVRVLDVKKCDYEAEYVKCDITNREEVISSTKDIEVLFHLGVNPNWYKNINNPEVDYNISVLGTVNVLEACIKNNINLILNTHKSAIKNHKTQMTF